MSQNSNTAIAIVGIDIGKNSFHVVALDHCAAQSRCVSSNRVAVLTAAMHTTLPTWVKLDRVSRVSPPFNFRFGPKATVSDRNTACREWDGPAALPPPTARRVGGGL